MIEDLTDLVLPTPAIDPESWSPNSLPEPKQSKRQSRLWQLNDSLQEAAAQYEQEMLHWTRHLPPGITEDYMDQVRFSGMLLSHNTSIFMTRPFPATTHKRRHRRTSRRS